MLVISFINIYYINGNGYNLDNKFQEDYVCSYVGKVVVYNYYRCNDIQYYFYYCYYGYYDICFYNIFGYYSCFFGVQQGDVFEFDGYEVFLQVLYVVLCFVLLFG